MIYILGMADANVIYQSEFLRAVLFDSHVPSGTLICEFDYLDNKRDGFPDIIDKPRLCAQGISVLKIDTSSNNWFLSDDVMHLAAVLRKSAENYDFVVSLCFSMGIMGALMFSDALNIKKILAFSSVVSIFEDDICDRRFKSFRKHVQNPNIRQMWKDGDKNIQGSLCFDPLVPIDRLQARLIHDYYPNLRPVALPAGGHPCIRVINEVYGFESVQKLIINNQFQPRYIRKIHKKCRDKSDVYRSVCTVNQRF